MYYPQFIPPWFQRLFPGITWSGKVRGPVVHLTFDDGPVPEVTTWVLDELKKYGQKATFFCVGDNVSKHPEIYLRILEEGHTTGNHTYRHVNGWKTGLHEYRDDVDKATTLIDSTLFRPPYGKMTWRQYNRVKRGHQIVMWSYLSGDFHPEFKATTCLNQVKSCSQDGCILVFHDNVKTFENVRNVLPGILQFYESAGIKSVPITRF